MENMTYSNFRSHLADALDRVVDDHQPILVTRQSGKPAVVMSLEDFKSYEETAYLMASANNATRLNQAIQQLEKKKGKIKGLIEE
ncbi:MAG: prevent-host-death protein [Gammaproteobacteria bacterium RIFCSPHIGHO2_12_FULL_38_11]|nr:MAG: prevent-host-death protein [Gammaproteobacteria bacterium RIFCSPHIGHO2_12_FULL_38_11]